MEDSPLLQSDPEDSIDEDVPIGSAGVGNMPPVVCTDLLPNIASMLSDQDQSNLALACKDFRMLINGYGKRAILISEGPSRDLFRWRRGLLQLALRHSNTLFAPLPAFTMLLTVILAGLYWDGLLQWPPWLVLVGVWLLYAVILAVLAATFLAWAYQYDFNSTDIPWEKRSIWAGQWYALMNSQNTMPIRRFIVMMSANEPGGARLICSCIAILLITFPILFFILGGRGTELGLPFCAIPLMLLVICVPIVVVLVHTNPAPAAPAAPAAAVDGAAPAAAAAGGVGVAAVAQPDIDANGGDGGEQGQQPPQQPDEQQQQQQDDLPGIGGGGVGAPGVWGGGLSGDWWVAKQMLDCISIDIIFILIVNSSSSVTQTAFEDMGFFAIFILCVPQVVVTLWYLSLFIVEYCGFRFLTLPPGFRRQASVKRTKVVLCALLILGSMFALEFMLAKHFRFFQSDHPADCHVSILNEPNAHFSCSPAAFGAPLPLYGSSPHAPSPAKPPSPSAAAALSAKTDPSLDATVAAAHTHTPPPPSSSLLLELDSYNSNKLQQRQQHRQQLQQLQQQQQQQQQQGADTTMSSLSLSLSSSMRAHPRAHSSHAHAKNVLIPVDDIVRATPPSSPAHDSTSPPRSSSPPIDIVYHRDKMGMEMITNLLQTASHDIRTVAHHLVDDVANVLASGGMPQPVVMPHPQAVIAPAAGGGGGGGGGGSNDMGSDDFGDWFSFRSTSRSTVADAPETGPIIANVSLFEPLKACTPYELPTTHKPAPARSRPLANRVVLVEQGDCDFATKGANALEAGAVAVLVISPDESLHDYPLSYQANLSIPIVQIRNELGMHLLHILQNLNRTQTVLPAPSFLFLEFPQPQESSVATISPSVSEPAHVEVLLDNEKVFPPFTKPASFFILLAPVLVLVLVTLYFTWPKYT